MRLLLNGKRVGYEVGKWGGGDREGELVLELDRGKVVGDVGVEGVIMVDVGLDVEGVMECVVRMVGDRKFLKDGRGYIVDVYGGEVNDLV